MNLLLAATTHIYSSAILAAILLLAIPDASFCFKARSPKYYIYGQPKPSDGRISRNINLPAAYWGEVTYKNTLSMKRQVTGIKFIDNAGNEPKISLSKLPPCYNPEIVITSRNQKHIDVKMEAYFKKP